MNQSFASSFIFPLPCARGKGPGLRLLYMPKVYEPAPWGPQMLESVVTVPTVGSDKGTRPHWPKTRGVRKLITKEMISFAMMVTGCVVRVIESWEASTIVWRGKR